jgi:5-methylthioadenosine/S-adenosylhomocysteine deaminase
VLVSPDGRLEAVGPDHGVPRPDGASSIGFPDAVLMPGLVNAHTHLELTGLRGRVPEADFFDWIQHVRRAKEALDEDAFFAAVRAGLQEAWRYGTTCVADTGTSGMAATVLSAFGGRGIAFQEAIGPRPEAARETLHRLRDTVTALRSQASTGVTVGVSPHAPYTVSRELYRRVAEYARAESLPVAAHIAESPAEVAFVAAGTGPFAESWRARNIALDARAASPVALLEEVGLLDGRLLAIHAVHTDQADIERLRRAGCALACCPRSNARHGHGEPPLARYLEAGLRLGLGTDSVASVEDLDLFAEARHARELAALSPEAALELITWRGAAALGLEQEIGTLAPGKWADLCIVRVDRHAAESPGQTPAAVLAAGAAGVVATYVAGRRVYSASPRTAGAVSTGSDTGAT